MKNSIQFGAMALLILVIALSRLLPHPSNFTPVAAMALFGGVYFNPKTMAWLVPVGALWLSDILLNNLIYKAYYPAFTLLPQTLMVTYFPMLLVVGLGIGLKKRFRLKSLIATGMASSLLFFAVSNFFHFTSEFGQFPKTFTGLMATYVAGLPFLKNAIFGDFFYGTILFGGAEALKRFIPQVVFSKAKTYDILKIL